MVSPLCRCRRRQAFPLGFAAGSVCLSPLGCSVQDICSVLSMFWSSCACLALLKIMRPSRCSLGAWEMGTSGHLWVDGQVASLRNIASSSGAEPNSSVGPSTPLSGHFSETLSLFPFQSPSFRLKCITQAGILQAGAPPIHSPNTFSKHHLFSHGREQGSQLIPSMSPCN